MKKHFTRALSLLAAACCAIGLMAPAAYAASVADATIDTAKTGSITLYKYDYTNSVKDEAWDDTYVSTGVADQEGVNEVLGEATRVGDTDSVSDLENGETSNGYAIAGVEFSYLKVADLRTYSEVENGSAKVMLLYGFDSNDGLLDILELTADDRYELADIEGKDVYYYESDVLNAALRSVLSADPTGTKNAMEEYIIANRGSDTTVGGAMPLTDADGKSSASNLKLGLYLLVETLVPEMVTSTTNPFFISLPMTSVDGTNATDGGHRWIYDVTVYPKNETGIVELEKTVRESKIDTATHTGSLTDIHDGYAHTATASAGDVVEYQIISNLPTITSAATNISVYTFVDTLSKGITYNKRTAEGKDGVLIEWFSDKDCTSKVAEWTQESGKFSVSYAAGENDTEVMTIAMTASGLAEINTAAGSFANVNNAGNMLYAGYSNYTIRITYSATLNSDATVNYGDAGNDNDVTLTWQRSSENYYDVLVDDAHVYTYAIDVTKTFSDKDSAEAAAAGMFDHVKFMLQNTSDGYFVKAELNKAEGVYYVVDHVATEAEGTQFVPVTTANGTHGQIVIKGLEDDTYILTEIETANGYSLLKDNMKIVISTKETDDVCSVYDEEAKLGVYQNDPHYGNYEGTDLELANIPQTQLEHKLLTASATVDDNKVTMLNDTDSTGASTDSANAIAPIQVVNRPGLDLPKTGDDSMILLTTLGALIVVCAGVMLFVVCKHGKKRENV